MFYELLSGQKAFDADSLHGVLYRVVQHEPTAGFVAPLTGADEPPAGE